MAKKSAVTTAPKAADNQSALPKARKPRTAAKSAPTQDQIAERAYHIYLQRNGAPGNPFEDWTRAEQELLAAVSAPKPRRKTKVVSIAA